ncbi:dehydrogenase/reductase SDR family member 12 [Pteropus medius]|uniref:dehydrogenase/reductase SDR family member 12 n=1 Tax=Pteropus vampyrus TaxID=132908 RepID=UPI00196A4F3D|nr:dehydrogenase/reductase SDR family member 12 [Pteropus giganteus]
MPPQSQAFSLHRLVFPAPYSHSFCASAASRTGYESACEDFVPDDLEVQVAGRAFLVTGGKSGIGKATAIEIAKRGGTVHLVCRDKDRVQGAKGEIIRESGNQNIFLLIVDLSDPKKIWKFVENFKQKHKLNVLINNAGCMVNKSKLTEDGLEKNFATNTLDMYILMTALIPVLEKEHDPRVAVVNSRINRHALSASLCGGPEAQERARRTLPSLSTCPAKNGAAQAACGRGGSGRRGDLISWRGGVREVQGAPFAVPSLCSAHLLWGRRRAALGSRQTLLVKTQFGKKVKPSQKSVPAAESQTRWAGLVLCAGSRLPCLAPEGHLFSHSFILLPVQRQQVVLTERWARAPQAVHFLSVHLGWVDTPGVRLSMPRFHARFRDGLCSVAQGADTVLWLALAPAASMKPSGRFFLDWKSAATPLSLARTPSSPAEEEKLSEILEELAQRFK